MIASHPAFRTACAVALVVTAAGCVGQRSSRAPAPVGVSRAERAVLTAALAYVAGGSHGNIAPTPLVVDDTSRADTGFGGSAGVTSPELVAAFRRANATAIVWRGPLPLPPFARYASAVGVDSLRVARGAITDAAGQHVELVRLSRVGFNRDATEAVAYIAITCGWLCGTGGWFIFQRTGAGWSVKQRVMNWLS